MLSFLAKHPPRTKIAHLDKILLDGGRSAVEFKPPGDRYLVANRLPPAPASGASNSSLAPPPHRHLWQDETFRVVRGTARFTMGRGGGGGRVGRVLLATAGRVVVMPRRVAHAFCNASADAELVLEFVLHPASRETDEAYFREHLLMSTFSFVRYLITGQGQRDVHRMWRRPFPREREGLHLPTYATDRELFLSGNVWGYRHDCNKAGLPRSLFQTLLFMHRGGVVMALPGPESISKAAGLLLNYIGGVLIGKMLLGFRDSYPEYYRGSSS